MTRTPYFTNATFKFLRDLAANNSRVWFQANRERYESQVRDAAVRFITDFGPRLSKISRYFRADPRPVGGSLFRIYRDTRFSKDKSPYKTYTGIQFRHESGRDAHCPGFYLHIEPKSLFAGVGIWHPDAQTLAKIRKRIVESPSSWNRVLNDARFRGRFDLSGDSLKRPPKGFDADHPLIEDLKRKDFIGVTYLNQKVVTAAGFLEEFADICRSGTALVKFLCKAVGVPF